jgi:hypothetical protein
MRTYHWLLGRQSTLTTSSKFLAYKVVLKPIWTYGLQLWGTASTSNIEILERFQSKTLCMITDPPWYVTNALLRRELHIPSVKEEIQRLSSQYSARLNSHPNLLTVTDLYLVAALLVAALLVAAYTRPYLCLVLI